MACNACAAARASQKTNNRVAKVSGKITSCALTKDLIQNWYNMLVCVKNNDKLATIRLSSVEANSHLGYLQSALNYPDNYCYYINKLQDFQFNILPRIVAYVSECIN